jgi:protein SCO1/2
MRCVKGIVMLIALTLASCDRAPEPKRYELHGQIVRVDPARKEVVVDHEDIKGFMPAMVMPYKVQDAGLLDGKQPGDLVTATLVVEEVNAYLSTLTTTGRAPLKATGTGPALTDLDLLRDGDVVPDQVLIDQAERPLSMPSLRGHRVALTFMYSRCPLPDFCPLMDKQFAEVQRLVRESPRLSDVRLLSVTLDPAFDTPAVLARHATALGADDRVWHFATGQPGEVLAFAKRFGAIVEPGESATALVHNLRTAIVDPQGRLVKTYSGNMWTPADLVADLEATPAPSR